MGSMKELRVLAVGSLLLGWQQETRDFDVTLHNVFVTETVGFDLFSLPDLRTAETHDRA